MVLGDYFENLWKSRIESKIVPELPWKNYQFQNYDNILKKYPNRIEGKKGIKKNITHYYKSQIFVQKFNFDEFFTQIFFDNFSREIKVVNS